MLFLLAALLGLASGQNCTIPACADGEKCYTSGVLAMECLKSIPFHSEWMDATLDVTMQSLENFGFKELYHNTGPPYSLKIDLMGDLKALGERTYANDLEFQEAIQHVFQSLMDAHTRYKKPMCYNAVFIQPIAFSLSIPDIEGSLDEEPRAFLTDNLFTDQYSLVFPGVVDFKDIIGKRVVLLNGLEFTTAISTWGDQHETRSNNPGARFNAALRSYLYRSSQSTNVLPLDDDDIKPLELTLEDGSVVVVPWMASYAAGLADESVCEAKASAEHAEEAVSLTRMQTLMDEPPNMPHKDVMVSADRTDREWLVHPNTVSYISCFVQTIKKDEDEDEIERVLVMKVASFSPPGKYLDAWTNFLGDAETCLSAEDLDLVVVDVMQNGGGYVCLGLRLLQLLVEDYNEDHTKVQMHYDLPHSDLMAKYIEAVNDPDPYPDPQAVEQILNPATQKPFVNGSAWYYPGRQVTMGGKVSQRSNIFSLNCAEAEELPANGFVPPAFMSRDRLILLTDGTCGSTCASFTKIPQEASQATLVGVGGLWAEPMDVSSFAGGFVCNPGYLANIANWSNTTFPAFKTNQSWQFGWAAWYSKRLPSRAVQFTQQEPDHRIPFWDFAHTSVDSNVSTLALSDLYDGLIESTIARARNDPGKKCNEKVYMVVVILLSVACAGLGAVVFIQHRKYTGARQADVQSSDSLLAFPAASYHDADER